MHCVGFDIASPKLAVSEINLSAETGMRKYEMATVKQSGQWICLAEGFN